MHQLFSPLMTEITLIFPHQLFRSHPALKKERPVYLVEEELFFNQYSFHKQKIMLHRASMKAFEDYLTKQGYQVTYVGAKQPAADIRLLLPALKQNGVTLIVYAATADRWLEQRLSRICREQGLQTEQVASPAFLNEMPAMNRYFDQRKTYFQTDFYTWQRKQRNLLLDPSGKPL